MVIVAIARYLQHWLHETKALAPLFRMSSTVYIWWALCIYDEIYTDMSKFNTGMPKTYFSMLWEEINYLNIGFRLTDLHWTQYHCIHWHYMLPGTLWDMAECMRVWSASSSLKNLEILSHRNTRTTQGRSCDDFQCGTIMLLSSIVPADLTST